MYQVMIVDDEEPVLDSFAYILRKDVTDFVLCGKARSGTEAVSMIQQLKPDLVFMDIQMPGIDGLEAIQQIRQQVPNTVFILATAYERFDIAQKAIPLGVFSYMVKPISRKTLLDELAKVKTHLDQLRDRDKHDLDDIYLLQKTKEDEKNRFLRSLIWRNYDENEWKKFLKLFRISCNSGSLYLIESVEDISEDLKISIYKSVIEKIQYKYKCLGTFVAGRMLIFFPEERSLNNLDFHLKSILTKLSPSSFVFGHGGVYPLSSIHRSFSEAFQPFATAEKKEKSYSAERERMQLICSSMLNLDDSGTQNLFEDYWIEIFNSFSFSVFQGKMVALFTRLLSRMDSHVLTALDISIDPAEEIMVLKSVDAWQQWSSNILKLFQDVNKVSDQQSYPRPLITALAYIRENYQKPLQLSLVADECGITGSYLSRLFKEHLDTTFIDYINRFRLNKAIILLEEKKYSIKEISYIVGYQDPNYFSRIFRRHMGISPSDLEKEGIKDDK